MSDLAKVLKAGLEPEMQAKFDAAIAKLAAGESLDPGTKDALKGILTMMVNFKDKLKDPHIQALAQLAGFLGSQTGGGDTSAAGADDGSGSAEGSAGVTGDGGDSDGDEDPDNVNAAAAGAAAAGADDGDKDATGKPKGAAGKDKQGKGATNKRGSGNMSGENSEVRAALAKQQAEFEAKLQKQHDELRKQNDEMRTKLRKQELRAEVEKNYSFLGDADSMVEMLFDFEKRGMREQMEEKLRAWNEQARKSDLFKEYGAGERGTPTENSAEGQLQKHADEIHKAAGGKLTPQQAMMKAWDSYPALREQSRDEDFARHKAEAH